MNPAPIFLTLLNLALWRGDAMEDPIARTERLTDIAVAIAGASASRDEAAALLALAEAETHFAALVHADRCSEMPKGQRCDHGHARSIFQLHRAACPALWELPSGDPRATAVAALCAIQLLRMGRYTCKSWAGAYSVFAGRRCSDPIGLRREQRMRQIRNMLDHGGLPYPAEPKLR